MKQCEFCGASMTEDAGFCGKCGRVPSQAAHRQTHISELSTIDISDASTLEDENQTILSASGKHLVPRSPSGILRPVTLLPIEDDEPEAEDDEEEKRKRAALFGLGLPLLGELADASTLNQAPVVHGTPPLGQTPILPGTPQIGQAPMLPGTPQVPGGPSFGPASAAMPSPLQQAYPPQPLPAPRPAQPPRLPGRPPLRPPTSSPGCLPMGAVVLAALLIILATTFGLGLTVLAPSLSLNGQSSTVPGGTITLHGQHFLPNSSITLTLDGGSPLYPIQAQRPGEPHNSQFARLNSAGLLLAADQQNSGDTISAQGDGTFSATLQISSTITPGTHTIHATEGVSHRSASLPFTIATASATPTATPTPTEAAPTATPTATATPSPTPTTAPPPPPTLYCATPGNLKLGPISELSTQTTSGGVTLCTSGTGTLTWRATWNQNQASWLHMAQTSGTVQAPNQIQTTISASAKNLTAGTYTANVTFIALESNTTEAVNITLTVKAGCVSAAPQELRFSGVANTSDPAGSQTVSVTNCGLTSNWSAAVSNGGSWLKLSSRSGTLKGGGSASVAVTASNLSAGLKAGTYQATITFSVGSHTATVSVTLVVQAAPTLSVTPTSVDTLSESCTSNENGSSTCTVTLINNSSASALTWSSSASINGVTVQADGNTIAAGGSEQVTFTVPAGNCGKTVTVTFTGPGNTASVTWSCVIIK
ncbi:MAG TPA: hypothetical protein VHD63_18420 [Ktedonobacteraceae bacterium]|nr:hypothetical protein [Ktedonobacteraceae bacterium]